MVKSFKADFRQGGNTILDDVYVRGCLFISDGCGIIFQDKSNSDKQSRLVVKDGSLRLEPIIDIIPGQPGGGSGGSGSDGNDGVANIVTVTQVGYAGTNFINVNDSSNIAISSESNAYGSRFISSDLPPANPEYCVDGDIYYYTGDD